MSSILFWRPRIHGPRFDGGEIPIQVLSDFTALRGMVINVAKWRYLLDNPDRQKSTLWLFDKVDLTLAGIAAGSEAPVINITTPDATLPGIAFPSNNGR